MTRPSSRALAVCAAAAGLAACQPWLMLALGDVDLGSLQALSATPALAGRMFAALLLFMPPMFVAYWIATWQFRPVLPVTASLALYCFGLWFALELLPRSFDWLVVHARWLPRFTAADDASRLVLEQQYALYRDANAALGFVRRHVLLAAQACLACCLWSDGLLGKLLASALGLSVLRLLLGSLALYAGMDWLYAIADPMYFVTAGAIYPLLATWAFRTRPRHGPAAPGLR
jgi:hypothetical protein